MTVLHLLQDVRQVTTLCHLLRFLFLPKILLPVIVDFVLAAKVQIEQLLVLLCSGELVLIDGRFGVSVRVGKIDEVISALLYVLLIEFDDCGLAIFFDLIDAVLVQILLLTSGEFPAPQISSPLRRMCCPPWSVSSPFLSIDLSAQILNLPCLLFFFAPAVKLGAGLRFPEALSIISVILRRERRLVLRTSKNTTSNKCRGHP